MSDSKQQTFKVEMTCDGCKKAVNAVLSKTKGVEKIAFDMDQKLVTVDGTATQEELLTAIKKTGKAVSAV